jgi:hypothetical protein
MVEGLSPNQPRIGTSAPGDVNIFEVPLVSGNRKREHVKDVGLTCGGLIYVNDRGEVHFALPQTSLDIDKPLNAVAAVFEAPEKKSDIINIVEDKEEPDASKQPNYFSRFDCPLISFAVRQIQSTYIARVACGVEHCLLLTSSGFVYSFGKNTHGQLGHALNE